MKYQFVLKDHLGKDFVSTSYSGHLLLLSFHPLAWTGVCTQQMKALDSLFSVWESKKVIPVGINIEPGPSKKAWAESMNLQKLRLLSDFWPHGSVAAQFGLFREKEGFSERANLLLSDKGEILWKKIYPIPELPDFNEIINWLEKEY